MAEAGETVTLGNAFQKGIRYFWKLLVIQLILGLASLVVFVPVIIGGVLMTVLTLGIALFALSLSSACWSRWASPSRSTPCSRRSP